MMVFITYANYQLWPIIDDHGFIVGMCLGGGGCHTDISHGHLGMDFPADT